MDSVVATHSAPPRTADRRPAGVPLPLPLQGLRVAHVLPWQLVGGVEQGTLRVAEALQTAGAECIAYCSGRDTPVHTLFREAGFETEDYVAEEPSIRRPRRYLQATAGLARSFRSRAVRVVHCGDLLAGYYAGLAGKLAGSRVLCHVRGEFADIPNKDRLFLRLIDHFIFVSQHTWRAFGHHVPAQRGSVLYDGIPEQPLPTAAEAQAVRSELGLPLDLPVVGMIARVAPGKDYETLIRAAVRLERQGVNARYLIVGDNTLSEIHRRRYEALDRELRALGLRDRFIFTGFRKDVSRLIAAMDVMVLVTHSEGLPLVLLEGMAAGKPVVATNVGGVSELLAPGSGGCLHEPGDDSALAARLLPLLAHPESALSEGATARTYVRSSFSQGQFRNRLTEIYQLRGQMSPATVVR